VAELTRRAGQGTEDRHPPRLPVVKAPRPDEALPEHVTSHASGGRDLWSDPLPERPRDPQAAVWELLGEVLDPELPISLVDLGLIYGVEFRSGWVGVDLTFTATACPCMEFIREDVEDRLTREAWIREVEIREVWDPPWTRDRISDAGRSRLRELGVGV
jgi:metal-sulfur cluster biosynthetic enzyme